jgi:hypothetical protein
MGLNPGCTKVTVTVPVCYDSGRRGTPVLKVLASENRGGLKVSSFVRSRFVLFTLKFSNKFANLVSSCERSKTKTSQRTLILSFVEINNCIL